MFDINAVDLRPVNTKPEEFENGGFTLKTHQMLSVCTTLKEFESTTTSGHFAFGSEENSGMEIT